MTTPLPTRADSFTISGWQADPARPMLHAHFECSRFGRFTETVSLPVAAEALTAYLNGEGAMVADLLTTALGVSYYKAGAARRIVFAPLRPAGRAMAEALYTEGLAEFFVRAGLPYPAALIFEGEVEGSHTPQADPAPAPGPALVAFGGGKDSYVARSMIEAAGDPVELASVTLSPAVQSVLTATAPAPVTFLTRALDPGLSKASAEGFNGHVPITAINMLMLTLYARLSGHHQVVFANERSADEPTMDIDGVTANHQYSKSGAFERLIRMAIHDADHQAPLPYSILRPYAELWIGRAFAQLKTPFERFTSCNRNFRLAGDADKRWCGNCAKCAFTSLILAPFISREEAVAIFGQPFPDREALQPYYRELCGLSDHKPWDCVGTIDESRAALWYAGQTRAWQESLMVRTLLPTVIDQIGQDALAHAWQTALTPHPTRIVPARYLNAAAGDV